MNRYWNICEQAFSNPDYTVDNAEMCIRYYDDEILIGFPGTKGKLGSPDWKANIKIMPEWIFNSVFPAGFVEVYLNLHGIVLDKVLDNMNKKIYFCGYSQGAAVACIAKQAMISHIGSLDIETVCFATPAANVKPDYNFYNDKDIVRVVPWPWTAKSGVVFGDNKFSDNFNYDTSPHNPKFYKEFCEKQWTGIENYDTL